MSRAVRHGGGADRLAARPRLPRSPLLRVVLACVLLAGALWLPGARATSLYRCSGTHGESVFTSSTAGYHDCRKLGGYDTAPAPVRRVPKASLRRVSGAVVGVRTSSAPMPVPADPVAAPALARATTSLPPASAVPVELRGHWSYRQSSHGDGSLPAVPAPAAQGDRVLRGAVYRIARADGSVEYTNIRPAGRAAQAAKMLFTYIATCYACGLHSNVHWGSLALNLTAYADAIHEASVEYGVDEAFLRAIIHAESAFNPHALSLKGAQGLMQLMPATASSMGVLDAFDTGQNIRGGARYLAILLRTFNGNEHLAAAAYNAGPGAVQRYSGVPPYAETQVYVQRVDTLRKRYAAALHPALTAARPAAG